MSRHIDDFRKDIVKALKASGKYSRSLSAQIMSLAGVLRTLSLANDEIDQLECTTIPVVTRYGNSTLAPHPVFKIQKDAQDAVTRQMKALGLTVEDLSGASEADPLIELTKKVAAAGAAEVVRPM